MGVAALFVAFLVVAVARDIFSYSNTIECNVHKKYLYECSGIPRGFYLYIIICAIALLAAYILCNLCDLLWLLIPNMAKFSRVMSAYRKGTSADDLVELNGIYFDNRDLKLLLNLLCVSTGISPALRILSLFDTKIRSKVEISEVEVTRAEDGEAVEVEFADAGLYKDVISKFEEVELIYIVEILPPVAGKSVMVVEPGHNIGLVEPRQKEDIEGAQAGENEMQTMKVNNATKMTKRVKFDGLKPEEKYTVRVSTVTNGRTIARKGRVVKPKMA